MIVSPTDGVTKGCSGCSDPLIIAAGAAGCRVTSAESQTSGSADVKSDAYHLDK